MPSISDRLDDRANLLGASDCERVATGLLAQPVNAVTSLGFVLAGGLILARALRAPQRRDMPARRAGTEPFPSARRSGAPPEPRDLPARRAGFRASRSARRSGAPPEPRDLPARRAGFRASRSARRSGAPSKPRDLPARRAGFRAF